MISKKQILYLALLLTVIPAMSAAGGDPAIASVDTIEVALVPEQTEWAPGDTVRINLMVTESGPAFNAYDAHVLYDPEVLSFLPAPTWRDQEGSLMVGTCSQTFHLYSVNPDSTVVSVNHSLLCPGASVTGPGELYKLMFIAKNVDEISCLRLLTMAPTNSRFFYDGAVVEPFTQEQGRILVGDVSAAVPGVRFESINLAAAPNPFNPRTTFSFELRESAVARLEVYSLDGRRIRVLADGVRGAGVHRVSWDGRDQDGRAMAAGKYIGRLKAGGAAARQSVVLVK